MELAVRVYGRGKWREVSRHLPGRPPGGCAAHFDVIMHGMGLSLSESCNVQARKSPPWTEEEDQTLMAAMRKYGIGNWSLVRKDLPGRQKAQCSHRFRKLNPGSAADVYQVLVATKRKMIPCRFSNAVTSSSSSQRVKRVRSPLVAADFEFDLREELTSENGVEYMALSCSEPDLKRAVEMVNANRVRRLRTALRAKHKAQSVGALTDETACSPERPDRKSVV